MNDDRAGVFSSLLLLAILTESSSVFTEDLLPDGLDLSIEAKKPLLFPLESEEMVLAMLSRLCPNVKESALFLFGAKQLLGGADM